MPYMGFFYRRLTRPVQIEPYTIGHVGRSDLLIVRVGVYLLLGQAYRLTGRQLDRAQHSRDEERQSAACELHMLCGPWIPASSSGQKPTYKLASTLNESTKLAHHHR